MLPTLILVAALLGQPVPALDAVLQSAALQMSFPAPTLLGQRCSECARLGLVSTVEPQRWQGYTEYTCSRGHFGSTTYQHRCDSLSCPYRDLTR